MSLVSVFNAPRSGGVRGGVFRAVQLLFVGASAAYAYLVAQLSSLMRPQQESPAEAATRLRMTATRRTADCCG